MQICKYCNKKQVEEVEEPPKGTFTPMQVGSKFIVGEHGGLVKVDKKPDNVDIVLIASDN